MLGRLPAPASPPSCPLDGRPSRPVVGVTSAEFRRGDDDGKGARCRLTGLGVRLRGGALRLPRPCRWVSRSAARDSRRWESLCRRRDGGEEGALQLLVVKSFSYCKIHHHTELRQAHFAFRHCI